MVKLTSSEGTEFIVDRDIAEQSVLLKNMLEDVGELEDFPIPLPNVTGPILQKVIEWCTHHRNDLAPASSDPASQHAPASGQPNPNSGTQASASGTAAGSALHTSGRGTGSDDIDEWDQEFCKVDQGTLFELILAANYLDIKPLLDLTCKTVANMIKGKTPEEIRKTFNIVNDFTPEEEEQVRRENEWCEDR